MRIRVAIVATVIAASIGLAAPSVNAAHERMVSPAWFEGELIDLSHDWGKATACNVSAEESRCFRTEAEMDDDIAQRQRTVQDRGVIVASLSTCASSLKLYNGTSYTGTVLNLSTRFSYINLSTYGFDNLASSYKVGACDVDMFAGAGGAGCLYPGDTSANSHAVAMSSGWNNVVSSVYIY